jgi:hypothetical protein
MHGPNDRSKVGEAYGKAFGRFKALVDIGSRQFIGYRRYFCMMYVCLYVFMYVCMYICIYTC